MAIRRRRLPSCATGARSSTITSRTTSWSSGTEHDLFDQLNLIQLLSRIGRTDVVARKVSLISIDSFPGHPRFKGLGELKADELGSLFAIRQPLTDAQYSAGRARMGRVPRCRSPAACRTPRDRHVGLAVSGRRARASSRGLSVDARRLVANRTPADDARSRRARSRSSLPPRWSCSTRAMARVYSRAASRLQSQVTAMGLSNNALLIGAFADADVPFMLRPPKRSYSDVNLF